MNQRSRDYLHSRGITDEAIEMYRIEGDDRKIIIPVKGFNKYRTYPEKNYFYDKGFSAALFGIEQIGSSRWCVLTEGELDALRLASLGIPAVSGSGGAKTFKDEWISELPQYVFICYDTDDVGVEAAKKIHWKIPNSRVVKLPVGKDVTEYLTLHSKEDFELLLTQSVMIQMPLEEPPVFRKTTARTNAELEEIKKIPISDYIKFTHGKAKCVFHSETNPSMQFYPKDNRVFCFSCGKGGDIVDVIQAMQGVDFKDAVKFLTGK